MYSQNFKHNNPSCPSGGFADILDLDIGNTPNGGAYQLQSQIHLGEIRQEIATVTVLMTTDPESQGRKSTFMQCTHLYTCTRHQLEQLVLLHAHVL